MNALRQMQQDFLDKVVSPDAPEEMSLGLKAYRDAYVLRIDEALRTDFDGLHLILGDQEMLALTTDYLQKHPSNNPSIRWAGTHYLIAVIRQSRPS